MYARSLILDLEVRFCYDAFYGIRFIKFASNANLILLENNETANL